jgi:hypothetical protein
MNHPNPLMFSEWLDCRHEIDFLKQRLEVYKSEDDIVSMSEVQLMLDQEIHNLKAIEVAGGAPLSSSLP